MAREFAPQPIRNIPLVAKLNEGMDARQVMMPADMKERKMELILAYPPKFLCFVKFGGFRKNCVWDIVIIMLSIQSIAYCGNHLF